MSLMHTTFEDGPARGARLALARAPVLLRVAVGPSGTVDALDQREDTAKPGETITVYVLTAPASVCFIDYQLPGGGRRVGERLMSGHYRMLRDQPGDDVLRDNAAWRAWCEANFVSIAPAWTRGKAVMP